MSMSKHTLYRKTRQGKEEVKKAQPTTIITLPIHKLKNLSSTDWWKRRHNPASNKNTDFVQDVEKCKFCLSIALAPDLPTDRCL